MPTISLCMIVKNEERHIMQCLNSVQGLVDEIIIVDTGSTDFTKEIALRYTDKIYDYKWNKDFSAARNYSLEHATGDYILVLDADEYIEGLDLRSLTKSGLDYYLMRIKNFLPQNEVVSHQAVRLFRNCLDIRFKGRIHESILSEGMQLKGVVTDLTIYHSGYLEDNFKEKDKHKRNIELLKLQLIQEPRGFDWFNLGKQHMVAAEYTESLDCFKKAYYLSREAVYLPYLLLCMAECLHQTGRDQEGLNLLRDTIPLYPEYTDLYLLQGKMYNRLGYHLDAEQAFKTCLKLGDMDTNVLWTFREGAGSHTAQILLAETYMQAGKAMEAFNLLHQVMQNKDLIHRTLPVLLLLASRADLPQEDVMEFIDEVYPVKTQDETRLLLEILFQCRSPLLERYIQKYFVKVNGIVKAVASQYSGNYIRAREQWVMEKTRTPQDLFMLSLLLRDEMLFELCCKAGKDARESWQIFRPLITGTGRMEELTAWHEAALLQTVELLIQQKQIASIEAILESLHQFGSLSLKILLMKKLVQYGHTKQVLIKLQRYMEEQGTLQEYVELLADIEICQERSHEAMGLLELLAQEKESYSIYQKMYWIHEKNGNDEGMNHARSRIAECYPTSMWGQAVLA